jgi:hypothetical protein
MEGAPGEAVANRMILCGFNPAWMQGTGVIGNGFGPEIFKPELLNESNMALGDDHHGSDSIVQGSSFANASSSVSGSLGLEASGMYGAATFRGSVEASFKLHGATDKSTSMFHHERRYQIGDQRMKCPEARPFLTDTAMGAIDDPQMSPERLFNDYGLYYAKKIEIGGTYSLWASSADEKCEDSSGFASAVQASVDAQGASGKLDTKMTGECNTAIGKSSYTAVQTIEGGDMKLFNFSGASGPALQVKEAAWCASVFESPVVISAILAPIWQLALDGPRLEQLRTAFEEFAMDPADKKIRAIDAYMAIIDKEKWHCTTRGPSMTGLIKHMDKVTCWPKDFRTEWEDHLNKASWHCNTRAPTLKKLHDVARAYKLALKK